MAASIAYNKLQKTREVKDRNANDSYLEKLQKKIAGEWKDKTIREILKEVPESKKNDVWEYLRFYVWDYE